MRLSPTYILWGIALSDAFFINILRGILSSSRSPRLIANLPSEVLQTLKDDENAAGAFICDILKGDIPTAVADLAEDIKDEITDDFKSITSFVESLPTLAPQILEDIGDVAEDAVDFVEAFFDDPKHAITKLEGKFTSFAGDIVSKAKCLFRHCSDQDDHPGAQKLSSACANVQRPAPATVSAYPTTSSGDDGHSQPPASSYSTPTPSYDDGSYRQPSPPPSYGTPTVSITSYVPASSSLRPSVEAASPSSSSGTHNSGSGGGGGSVGSSGDAIVVNMAYMLAVPLLIVLLLGRKVLIW